MTTVAFASAKASPGATTTVLGLAACWSPDRRVLLVEADADGGVLAARFGLPSEPGLSTYALDSRRDAPPLLPRHTQCLPRPGVHTLVAPPVADHAERALTLASDTLVGGLQHDVPPDMDVLIDVGRMRPSTDPLVALADAVLVVARPRLDEVGQLGPRLQRLRGVTRGVGLVLIGERPYGPNEVAATLQTEVVAVLPDDPAAAAALCGHGTGWSLQRSALVRSLRAAVDELRTWVRPYERSTAVEAAS